MIRNLGPSRAKTSGVFFHFSLRGVWKNWDTFGVSYDQAKSSNSLVIIDIETPILKELFYCVESSPGSQESHTHVAIHTAPPERTPIKMAKLISNYCNRVLRQKITLNEIQWKQVNSHFPCIRAYHLGGGHKPACNPGPVWVHPTGYQRSGFNSKGSLKIKSLEEKTREHVNLINEIKDPNFGMSDFGIKHACHPLALWNWKQLNTELQIEEVKKAIKSPDLIQWPWMKKENRHIYVRVGSTKLLDLMEEVLGLKLYKWDYSQIFQDDYVGQKYILFPNFDIANFHNQNIKLPFFTHLASGKAYISHKYEKSVLVHPQVILILVSSRVPTQAMRGLLNTQAEGDEFARNFRLILNSRLSFFKMGMSFSILKKCKVHHLRDFQKLLFRNCNVQLSAKHPITEDDTSQGSCISSPCRFRDSNQNITIQILLSKHLTIENNIDTHNNINIYQNNFQLNVPEGGRPKGMDGVFSEQYKQDYFTNSSQPVTGQTQSQTSLSTQKKKISWYENKDYADDDDDNLPLRSKKVKTQKDQNLLIKDSQQIPPQPIELVLEQVRSVNFQLAQILTVQQNMQQLFQQQPFSQIPPYFYQQQQQQQQNFSYDKALDFAQQESPSAQIPNHLFRNI